MKPDNRCLIQNSSITKIFIIISICLIITCKKVDEFQKIRDGNFDLVAKGKYEGKLNFLKQGNEYEDIVKVCRTEIEKNSDVLPAISKRYFSISENLFYKFKFVAIDKEKNNLILRYFARIMSHSLYAGYQIQFVLDIDSKKLIHIFTAEVPLE